MDKNIVYVCPYCKVETILQARNCFVVETVSGLSKAFIHCKRKSCRADMPLIRAHTLQVLLQREAETEILECETCLCKQRVNFENCATTLAGDGEIQGFFFCQKQTCGNQVYLQGKQLQFLLQLPSRRNAQLQKIIDDFNS